MQLTKSLRLAWAKDNIQVNAILPGWIDTDLTRKRASRFQGLMKASRANAGGRWGAPDDFAGIAVFLAQPGFGFHHRHRHPGRRWIFGADVKAPAPQNGLSPTIVQRRITRISLASSKPVARCSVQRLSQTRHWRGAQRCV